MLGLTLVNNLLLLLKTKQVRRYELLIFVFNKGFVLSYNLLISDKLSDKSCS